MQKMFNWDDLRFFLDVARSQSLSASSTNLGIYHTTVARRIKALEESLGVQLFEKSPRGYTLTSPGVQLLRHAEQVEASCISVQELLSGEDSKLSGIVRMGVPEGFGSYFLMELLNKFYQQYPNIELDIIALPQSLSVSKREAHIVISPVQPTADYLIVRQLTDYEMHLYGSREYLSCMPPVRNLADLKERSLIANDAEIRTIPGYQFLDELFAEVRPKLLLKSINSQLAAVEAGLGISLLPCYMTRFRKDLCVVLPDSMKVRQTFWMSMHGDMRHVQRITAVWDWLKSVVTTNRSAFLRDDAPSATHT